VILPFGYQRGPTLSISPFFQTQEASFGKYTSTPSWYIDEKGQNKTYDLLTFVPNFIVNVGLPDTVEGEYFQEVALERLRELKKKWELEDADTNARGVELEFFSVYAYLLEYERALMKDMPLVPITFYIMLLFTCVAFHRLGLGSKKSPDVIEPSRFSLGILSTITIGFSMTAGTLYDLLAVSLDYPGRSLTQLQSRT